MMKKVLIEEISLRQNIKNISDFLKNKNSKKFDDIFSLEKFAINASKKIASVMFNEALCEFGQDLKHEQQLSETLADIFTNIYVAESVLCRVQQSQSLKKISKMSLIIGKICITELLLEIKSMVPKCTNHIFSESTPTEIESMLSQLEKLITLNTDIISMKTKLAEFMYTQKQYPF